MGIANTLVEKVMNYRSTVKPKIDSFVDPTLFWIAANTAYIYGGAQLLDYVSNHTEKYEGLSMLGTYCVLIPGIFAANKFLINPITNKINNFHKRKVLRKREVNALSWVKTLAASGTLAGFILSNSYGSAFENYAFDGERVIESFSRQGHTLKDITEDAEEEFVDESPVSLAPELPKDINIDNIKKYDKHSDHGRFLRVYRWDNIISKVEKQYSIPEGLLSGLAMRESYGNPLELNQGSDGGAGLFQFQPGTAREYGLKTYGHSRKTGRDRNHGLKLISLAKSNNW